MWRHAKVYNAVLTRDLHRLDLPPAEISWHLIWLWHDGYVGFDQDGVPVAERHAVIRRRPAAA